MLCLLIFVDFVCSFFFHFMMKQQQKLSSFFYAEAMVVEPEEYEDGLDKDGSKAGVQ